MLKVIDDKFVVDIFCDAFEPECVLQAAGDLQSDLRKVSGLSPVVKRYLPYEEQGFIVIGSLQNERFREYAARQGIDVTRLAGTGKTTYSRPSDHNTKTSLFAEAINGGPCLESTSFVLNT